MMPADHVIKICVDNVVHMAKCYVTDLMNFTKIQYYLKSYLENDFLHLEQTTHDSRSTECRLIFSSSF